ncbi:phage tail protein [Klebsiella pneumoniae]
MAGKKFYSLITTAGLERLADAAVSGEPVGFALMAVGDGNGQEDEKRYRITSIGIYNLGRWQDNIYWEFAEHIGYEFLCVVQ